MKKLILITAISFLALMSYGQLTFTDNGDAIGVTGGGESLNFSKTGLLIQKHNDNIEFVTGGRLFRYNLAYIDVPAYSTIDSVYDEIATWLSGSYVFSGGITADSATIDWLTGDTVIYDYIEGDTILVNKLIWPDANDGAPIGTATVAFSDLFLAEGAVINWDNGDATITQANNVVTLAGANLTVPTATVTTLTDGTQSQTAGDITGGNIWAADSITANYFTDGTFAVTGGTFTGIVSLSDGTATWDDTQDLRGFDSIVASNYNDGTFNVTTGIFTGVASITDGTASWTDSQDLEGFDTISATYITDGTLNITTGNISSANLIGADTVTANYFSGSVIDGQVVSDTSSWDATAFDIADMVEFADTTLLIATDYELISFVEWSDTTSTITTAFDMLDKINFSDTTALIATDYELVSFVEWSDTTATIATQFDLTSYVTPTYTGDLDITGKVAASDSLCIGKFRFIVFNDTLCSITGTDTVRQHPPR